MTEAEKKANKNSKNKKFKPFKKFNDFLDKTRIFMHDNPDYMIFLIMSVLVSFMYEPYGITRTIPLLILAAFLLGIIYGRRKRIMIHTIVGVLVFTSVSQDIELSAIIIIVAFLLSFAGCYAARFLEQFKKVNIIQNFIRGLITLFVVALALITYSYEFGNPFGYFATKNSVDDYLIANNNLNMYYVGVTYDSSIHAYVYNAVDKDDTKVEHKFVYDAFKKEVFEYDELMNMLKNKSQDTSDEEVNEEVNENTNVIFE